MTTDRGEEVRRRMNEEAETIPVSNRAWQTIRGRAQRRSPLSPRLRVAIGVVVGATLGIAGVLGIQGMMGRFGSVDLQTRGPAEEPPLVEPSPSSSLLSTSPKTSLSPSPSPSPSRGPVALPRGLPASFFATNGFTIDEIDAESGQKIRTATHARAGEEFLSMEMSPDGRTLYFSKQRSECEAGILAVPVSGGKAQPVVDQGSEPAIDITQSKVAFFKDWCQALVIAVRDLVSGQEKTWSVRVPGGAYVPIPRGLAWGPDSRTLAVAWEVGDKSEMRLFDTNSDKNPMDYETIHDGTHWESMRFPTIDRLWRLWGQAEQQLLGDIVVRFKVRGAADGGPGRVGDHWDAVFPDGDEIHFVDPHTSGAIVLYSVDSGIYRSTAKLEGRGTRIPGPTYRLFEW